MRPLFHPSRTSLQAWLNGTDDDPKLDAHIAICKRCADILEGLDADHGSDVGTGPGPTAHDVPTTERAEDDAGAGLGGTLAGALAVALAPPDDLSERLEHKVTKRLDSRMMFDVLSDLFGAGVETSRMLILEEAESDE